MTRTPVRRPRAMARAVFGAPVPVAVPAGEAITERADRMARFAAGARRVVARAAVAGGVVAAGWLLAVLFGMFFSATPAAASTAAAHLAAADAADAAGGAATGVTARDDSRSSTSHAVTGSIMDGFPTGDGGISAADDAEAMAGRTVDGLTSQSDPGLPPSSTASKILGTDGLVPGGGGGPFGPGMGDIARSVYDPGLQARHVVVARELPPVVRTAADDPSFSPD
ncbi:hypothetical protein GCM10010149_58950 [Nonomuraea roseoviolacea subsp. roseoviolacea]|uniref:hypothetical protein n=1 Tax=Nonomuraea roseoviolacea TaxID=103837 RepID=UPI0031DA262B